MRPILAVYHETDLIERDGVSSLDAGGIFTAAIGISNRQHVGISQFSLVMTRALARCWNTAAILLSHIKHIVCLCAEKQMIRSNTNRIVAVMANVHAFRNWTVSQCPCEAMCEHLTVSSVGRGTASVFTSATVPFPAAISNDHRFPEANAFGFRSNFWHRHSANATTS